MKSFYRLMLGKSSCFASQCFAGGFVGTDFNIAQDLSDHLPETFREFNSQFIPVFLATHPEKSRISAGLACGMIWTVSKGIAEGDIVLSPDGTGTYQLGEITGPYTYAEGEILPHRRPVRWFDTPLPRDEMSEPLRNSAGSIGTVCNLTPHAPELEQLLGGTLAPKLIATDASIEDPTNFALERHLEDFLVHNWSQTELGRDYDIYTEEGEIVGQQFLTDTGPLDILAISKDRKTLLVVELKKGRASDAVVGQIQRYMGYVIETLAEPQQAVRGAIIALDDDQRIRRALQVAQGIEFYRYEISFSLKKANE